ncbi:MAG: phosphatidate cytidylyltransferase [Rhizobiales bacterium 63-7]|nr:MAG: phosphatidate cytidylyltransferase [Rhizobiales bacterium 63-7]
MSQELKLRIVSAIVLAVIVLGATWMGGAAFRIVCAVIGLLIYSEWSTITGLASRVVGGNAFGWFALAVIAGNTVFGAEDLAIPLLGGCVFTAVLLTVFNRSGTWWLPGGILYAGLSCVSLAAIRDDDHIGLAAMLFVFAVVWGTDILAYFVGRAIGGPKLAPRISPGKTWSGAIGGASAGVIAGAIASYSAAGSVGLWTVAIALMLSVSSQISDLFESFIKRRFGVKDSGRIIPGHGGVMDRVDGLVFACFAAFILAVWFSVLGDGSLSSVGAFLFNR